MPAESQSKTNGLEIKLILTKTRPVTRSVRKSSGLLGATKHLYNWLCPLVGWLVGRVTHSFDDPHVAPYWPTWPRSSVLSL